MRNGAWMQRMVGVVVQTARQRAEWHASIVECL